MQAEPLRIYIAGPYTAATEEQRLRNVTRAIDAGIAILRKGHVPYIPHLTHYVDARAKDRSIRLRWEEYIHWDLAWLSLCDALLYLGGSRGADLEMEEARRARKTIFRSLDEIPVATARRVKPHVRGARSLLSGGPARKRRSALLTR